MKKGMVLSSVLILALAIVGSYMLFPYTQQDTTPSSEKPDFVKKYADGLYEVRSFASNSPLCGTDEVVEVSTNKMIFDSYMCEAEIADIQVKGDKVVIIKSSTMGKEEIVVSR